VAQKTFKILSIEDNAADSELIKILFSRGDCQCEVRVIEDGVQALDALFGRGEFENAWAPDLILLDLNLQKKDGREVLKEIKTDERLRSIPVLIFTTSNSTKDIDDMYALGANAYLSKPIDLAEFDSMIRGIECFWLKLTHLPSSGGRW
jgi:two-component system, chemotaxis family, response regulator Rcp1